MESIYDVLFFGSSPAALTAATLLTKKGKHIAVIEPSARLGNPYGELSNRGFVFDRYPIPVVDVELAMTLMAAIHVERSRKPRFNRPQYYLRRQEDLVEYQDAESLQGVGDLLDRHGYHLSASSTIASGILGTIRHKIFGRFRPPPCSADEILQQAGVGAECQKAAAAFLSTMGYSAASAPAETLRLFAMATEAGFPYPIGGDAWIIRTMVDFLDQHHVTFDLHPRLIRCNYDSGIWNLEERKRGRRWRANELVFDAEPGVHLENTPAPPEFAHPLAAAPQQLLSVHLGIKGKPWISHHHTVLIPDEPLAETAELSDFRQLPLRLDLPGKSDQRRSPRDGWGLSVRLPGAQWRPTELEEAAGNQVATEIFEWLALLFKADSPGELVTVDWQTRRSPDSPMTQPDRRVDSVLRGEPHHWWIGENYQNGPGLTFALKQGVELARLYLTADR